MTLRLLSLGALTLALLPLTTTAQSLPRTYGYVVDSRGEIVRSGYNKCWRTGYWTPALAIAECDPPLVKVDPPKPAPVVVAPAPAPAPVVAAPAPAPAPAPVVAPPPAPEPVVTARAAVAVPAVAPEPAKPAPKKKIAIAGNASFATGKSELSAAGKAEIDREVLVPLAGLARIDAITVEGHTDPMGSEKKNIQLSKERAESVKAYLISQGVKAEITTQGLGSSVPLDNVKCDAKQSRAKLAACYAPLRRIEVDVSGVPK